MRLINTSQFLEQTNNQFIQPLPKTLDAFVLADMAVHGQQPLVIIANSSFELQRLHRELNTFVANEIEICMFEDWEILPYDLFSPHQDIISSRLKTLHQIQEFKRGIILISAATLLQRLAPVNFLLQHSLIINKGDEVDMLAMRERLVNAGYFAVDQVMEHGEFALRGSILDMFPMGSDVPFRLDFFDNEVDSIKLFDTETQRSSDATDRIQLLPAKEFPTNEDGIKRFRRNWRAEFDITNKNSLYHRVSDAEFPAGIEFYLPFFHEQLVSFLDYLPENALLIRDHNFQSAIESEWSEIDERYEQRRHDISMPILAPERLYYTIPEINQHINNYQRIEFSSKAKSTFISLNEIPDLTIEHQKTQPLHKLIQWLSDSDARLVISADSAGRREVIKQLFQDHKIPLNSIDNWRDGLVSESTLNICIGHLHAGFWLEEHNFALIGENLLFGQSQTQQQRQVESSIDADAIIKNLAELKIGDAVVHSEHGVGRYLGLESLTTDGIIAEYLSLQYADGDKLYVPVQMLHLIGRYTGASADSTPLHRLGSEQWSKAKQRAAKRARDVAAELLDIYARRAAKPGLAYRIPEQDYSRFCAEFPFQTTVDQENAITAMVKDLQADRPMDRLVCGDVGFGKTEVALRAAFIVTQNLKQVAVLVPTTLLAQQHYESFTDRFADWPINIAVLSRFRSAKEQVNILKDVANGKIDILIGTHKLLSKDLHFDRLGLVVVDEEHRFGVNQKEKIKRLRSEVDVLTLTATPIPRTLNMSFAGIRDLSIIASPPARRLAIKTFVREYNKPLIREAILREIHRGGQVYFLHNDVASIDKTARMLGELIPEARIGIGHGQMREKDLERLMQEFYQQRFNVLVATTIIETGIDVPSANTIIIERADKFGLAQLHQLRGRVGRSHHQAYAFLLTPHRKQMTKDAHKRLEAIETYTDLGAGFVLATQDMEIRGAGELLGDEQSGQIQSIGFSLYMELLDSAVQALKEGKEPSLQQSLSNKTEIDLGEAALIPEDYIADVGMRLSFYKRIANAKSSEALDALQVELIDRFGLLPDVLKNLFSISLLKLTTTAFGMLTIQMDDETGSIEFAPDAPIEPMSLIQLMQSGYLSAKMRSATKLSFDHDAQLTIDKVNVINLICDKLTLNKS